MRYLALALLTGGLVAGTGTVQAADVAIYGQAHLATSYLDDGADYSARNLSSNASRLGFRARHDAGPDLRAVMQLEAALLLDGSGNENLTSRDSFLGLEGGWGLLRGGLFDTPNKRLRGNVDLFGNQVGDARNIVRGNYGGNQGFDERFRKGIAYRTPQVNGFLADVHYSVDSQENGNAEDGNENDAWSASVSYQQGPAYAAIAHERWNFEESDDERDVTRIAAYYDIAAFRLTGFAQTASDPDDNAYGLGVRYALLPVVLLKAQYFRLDADDGDFDADMIAVGADYRYSPQLQFYLNYARIDNDDGQSLQPWVAGSSLERRIDATGEAADAVAVGAMYRF